MTTTIQVVADRYEFKIAWIVDGEEGSAIGETRYTARRPLDPDRREDWAAYHAIKPLADGRLRDRGTFTFNSHTSAMTALRVARDAVKTERAVIVAEKQNRPMPDWATTALKAGWKPPKGWTP